VQIAFRPLRCAARSRRKAQFLPPHLEFQFRNSFPPANNPPRCYAYILRKDWVAACKQQKAIEQD
jgi:hypothetical protein